MEKKEHSLGSKREPPPFEIDDHNGGRSQQTILIMVLGA